MHLNEVYEVACEYFNVTDEEIRELLPSGKQTLIRNRCA